MTEEEFDKARFHKKQKCEVTRDWGANTVSTANNKYEGYITAVDFNTRLIRVVSFVGHGRSGKNVNCKFVTLTD